jgi:hypothetical protein
MFFHTLSMCYNLSKHPEKAQNFIFDLQNSFINTGNLCSGSRSEICGKFTNVMLEKNGTDQLDRSCEK